MDNLDTGTALGLALALVIVGLIILCVDIVIFVLWLKYRFELQAAQQYPSYPGAYPPQTAPQPGQPWAEQPSAPIVPTVYPPPLPPLPDESMEAATQEAVDPQSENREYATLSGQESSQGETGSVAPAPPQVFRPTPVLPYPRPPFAPTWSVVHPFVSFQLIFLVVQVLATVFLLPAILPGMFSSQQGSAPTHSPAAQTRTQRPRTGEQQPGKATPPKSSGAPQQTEARPATPTKPQSEGESLTDGLFSPYGLTVQITALFLQNVLFVVVVALFVRRYGTSLKEIGLRNPTPKEILLGVGLGVAVFLMAIAGEKGVSVVLTHISPELAARLTKLTEAITAGGLFEKIQSNGWKFMFVLAGAVAAPIGEEVFFRGFLYNALKKRWGVLVGILVSALAFALVHLGPLAVVIIFPMGIILAYVYERTRSLWVTIVIHMVNNGTAFLLAWFWPQLGR